MKFKWLKIALFTSGAVVLAVVLLLLVLLRTELGAGWVMTIAQDQVDGLEIGRWSGSLHSGLQLKQVRFLTETAALSAAETRVAIRPRLSPPGLRVEWLEISDAVYQDIGSGPGADATGLPASLELPFELDLPDVVISGIQVLDASGDPLFVAERFSASATVAGQAQLHAVELVAPQGSASMSGRIALQHPFAFDLDLHAGASVPVQSEQQDLRANLTAGVQGTLEDYALELSGTLTPPGFASHEVRASSRGSLSALSISRLEVTGPDIRAGGAASLDWVAMAAALKGFELEVPGTAIHVRADLDADLQSNRLEGSLDWSNLAWPLRIEPPQYASSQGAMQLSGTLDEWRLSADAQLEATGYPQGRVRLDLNGDRERLQARIIEGRVLGGLLAGTAGYRWSDGQRVTADIHFENISTETLAADYPVLLNGALDLDGRLEPLLMSLNLRNLSGTALGRPFNANGGIDIDGKAINARDFKIVSGDSHLVLDGYPDEEGGLNFSLGVSDLAEFVPEASGALDAQGALQLHSGWPVLRMSASGDDLAWQDLRLASLRVHETAVAPGNRASALVLELSQLEVAGNMVDRLTAEVQADPAMQMVRIDAMRGGGRLTAEVTGALQQAVEPSGEWSWPGELAAAELSWRDTHRIALERAAALEVKPSSFRLEEACLAGPSESRACLFAGGSSVDGAEFRAQIKRIDLGLFREALGMEVLMTHQVSGDLNLVRPADGKPSGSAEFKLTPGAFLFPDDPEPILETGEGSFGFSMTHGRLNAGRIDIPFTGGGLIDIDFEVPDVTRGLSADLDGRLLVDFNELDIVAIAVPRADEITGQLLADLAVTGTVGKPTFSGRFDLSDGVLRNDASGLRLHGIQLSGDLAADGVSRLEGKFQAEEGMGNLEARVDLRDLREPKFELGVSGSNLRLFNSEDLMVVVDPDLSLVVQPGVVTFGGAIAIPRARIAPAVIPQQTLGESNDLVIVAGQVSEVEEEVEAIPLQILGDISLTLGDDVILDVAVANFGMKGQVDFDWQGEPLPLADGGFSLSGEILAFGQLLEITQGAISFPSVPANNPHLNIQAERRIYGNSEIRRAGLLVTGTVRRPVLEPYTDPMTNRDRAQTLLVTGSDFNMERGVGAVDIGTYIAPRVFVSYGVGVFENDNILSIRYDLGRGWGIKASSGERSTGVDLNYTLDN